ncbi:pantoate--beta-alanine ligase [Gleimia coleocanis DSM 15436]|uniref:Pantothenate synthetase n=1 Tax=Gleimia coleocanis DSM 15436 TaxID=525245 RepID=C0VYJ9_9ACTO|nr:pantoate--beta-alanine ligase [Gleimia coleocanis]EEH64502.1 pantoate--beta-alanine ligase [Gleimia coleocanis DSM 15436]
MSELKLPAVVKTRAELITTLENQRDAHPRQLIGLVMTMGALHAGHLSLVEEARKHSDYIVVSIFVNPTQFAPNEDFDAYPRQLEKDLELLATVGTDLVFAPTPEEIYPNGESRVTINPGPTATVLEGKTRPTHFAGVCQVVHKVINLVSPNVAVFGQKDAQQLAIIRQMVSDLDMSVTIVGAPIVRAEDGLALSSRNAYLSPVQRETALSLSASLRAGVSIATQGGTRAEILAAAETVISEASATADSQATLVLDYIALVDPVTFEDVDHGPAVLAIAAKVGTTRLIDNYLVEVK